MYYPEHLVELRTLASIMQLTHDHTAMGASVKMLMVSRKPFNDLNVSDKSTKMKKMLEN